MKQKLMAPLIILSVPMLISFLSGVFGWDFDDGFYLLIGLSMMVGIIWMWYVMLTNQ